MQLFPNVKGFGSKGRGRDMIQSNPRTLGNLAENPAQAVAESWLWSAAALMLILLGRNVFGASSWVLANDNALGGMRALFLKHWRQAS